MSLDDLKDDIEENYSDIGEELDVTLDRETRNELAMLDVALEPEETDELVRRAIHMLFQTTVETGKLDFNLRRSHDVTYDEYLMGATIDTYKEEMGMAQPEPNEDRRYQF